MKILEDIIPHKVSNVLLITW